MARITTSQAAILGSLWDLIQNFANNGFTASELNEAVAGIARDTGASLSFSDYRDISVLYGFARRMYNAATEAQNALDDTIIGPEHQSIPPWARDEQVVNTSPVWHVTYTFTYIDADGNTNTDYKTSVFEMTFPATIGDLKAAINEDAQALADKYGVDLQEVGLEQILAVLVMRTVPIHNLRPNHAVWTPPVVAYFDSETSWHDVDGKEVHQLRCWAARLDVRRSSRKTPQPSQADHGVTGEDLGSCLAIWSKAHPTLWVYAHNLAFDLTVTGVTSQLAGYGWKVTEFALDTDAPFVRMASGEHRITFCDSHSWLRAELEEIAAKMGRSKLPLPANGSPLERWIARCGVDVDLLADAMNELMDWWDANQLGKWSLTGPSSGWNAMRHRINARRFTIDPSPEGIAADRRAVYGGRRGLWRHGSQPGGRYTEIDFTAAYPTIAACLPLPLERMARFASLPADHRWLHSDRHGVIAEVAMTATIPRWPCRIAGRVWYPVGDFTTTLAGPDIAEAIRLGALVSIGAGYVHRLGLAMKPWAQWCLELSAGSEQGVPYAVQAWAKHCGRAVIGKWAQRGYQTLEIGPAPRMGWWATEGWNHTAGVRASVIDFDGRRWQVCASQNGDNCYPAVVSWVESYVRVRLGRMIDSLPAKAIISCDTDGIIVNEKHIANMPGACDALWPLVPRVKKTYSSIQLIGPQHMIVDGNPVMAGVPQSAKQLPDGRLTARIWPKMMWQMANSQAGAYVRPDQSYRIAGSYAPGWVTSGGDVLPLQVRRDDSGKNIIVPWPSTGYAASGIQLNATQNPALRRYMDG